MAVSGSFDTHLFSYRFNGLEYTVDIPAKDADEAKARLKALAWAYYDGVLVTRISGRKGAPIRFAVTVRNLLYGLFRSAR